MAGRWTTRDPIEFAAQDTNLFRYVVNQSTNANDPSGLTKGGKQHVKPTELNGTETVDEITEIIDKLVKKDKKKFARRLEELRGWRKIVKRGGAFGIAIGAILVAPEIAQAGEEGGLIGAGGAIGGMIIEAGIEAGGATLVGAGIMTGAYYGGTTITVVGGGTAIGIGGAAIVGGGAVLVGGIGYVAGDKIGGITVGGDTIHGHIGNAIYNVAPGFWGWVFK